MIYAVAFFGLHLKGNGDWESILSEEFDKIRTELEFTSQ